MRLKGCVMLRILASASGLCGFALVALRLQPLLQKGLESWCMQKAFPEEPSSGSALTIYLFDLGQAAGIS